MIHPTQQEKGWHFRIEKQDYDRSGIHQITKMKKPRKSGVFWNYLVANPRFELGTCGL